MTERAQTPAAAPSVARSSALMASGTLVSRVLGLLRQTMTIGVVGAVGLAADAWNAANTLPNNFHLLLAGGVLNAVIVPQIVKASRRADGDEYVNRLLTLAMTIMGAATVLLTLAAPALVWLVVSKDWGDDARGLAVAFALICLPQMFFYGLYTLLGQVLTANNRFGAFMWAPALANVVAIAGLGWFMLSGRQDVQDVGLWDSTMIWVLAGSATLSIVVQALVLIPALRRIGFRYRPVWGLRGYGLGSASKMATWAFGAVAVGQVAFLLVTTPVLTGAAFDAERAGAPAAGLTSYGFAFLIFMLPHSIITVSLVTAIFTRLSGNAQDGDTEAVAADLRQGMRMPAVVLFPGTAAMVLLAPWALQALLFSTPAADARAATGVLVAMCLGLVPYGWFYLVQRACYAYEDGRTPFVLQLVVTVISVAFTLVGAASGFEHTATWVGVGQTVGNLVGAILGFVLLRRRLGSLGLASVVQQNVRLLLSTLLATLVAGALLLGMTRVLDEGWLSAVLVTGVCGVVLLVVALLVAARLRVTEVTAVLQPVTRRLRRA
ncbi:murein biosynthesis integral membrane protein MurJ [Janibacter melonis]|uniref:murein biosynthesis integral membrane protein MurJ n=1 Tax=Janibacter melonis TaxID=262209 RepID=UPI0020442AAB|nr:murein biosynthesis integral membrane protein MurJ [Janibacter melonis]MCM3555968.1 murein biosynthesis integral membrane protein MurJ [Janibacter melonis]